tara:strand:+ start:164 stop:745 length:582 start_codon:yes stop_codon:yes gene_type:complete
MAWRKAGTTTLGSAGSTITVSSLSSNKFMNTMHHQFASSGTPACSYRMGNGSLDTGSNYTLRKSENGGSDETLTSIARADFAGGTPSTLGIGYVINIASEEKLGIYFAVEQSTAGAGNAPNRRETVAKYTNTSDEIDTYGMVNLASGSYDTGSNATVLGSDGTESLNVQDGAVYYDTTLNKEYVLYNNVWTEL